MKIETQTYMFLRSFFMAAIALLLTFVMSFCLIGCGSDDGDKSGKNGSNSGQSGNSSGQNGQTIHPDSIDKPNVIKA